LRAVFPPPVKKLGEIEDRLAAAVENERASLGPMGGGGQVVGGSLCTNLAAPVRLAGSSVPISNHINVGDRMSIEETARLTGRRSRRRSPCRAAAAGPRSSDPSPPRPRRRASST
jgi:hypothetical protein